MSPTASSKAISRKEGFEAKARAGGWKCSRCGKEITFDDRKAYLSSQRCARCHAEIDTENNPAAAV